MNEKLKPFYRTIVLISLIAASFYLGRRSAPTAAQGNLGVAQAGLNQRTAHTIPKLPHISVNRADTQTTPELGEREMKARLRDLEDEGNQAAIAAMSSREATIYLPVYSHLGLSENQSTELMSERERIHEASQAVNSSLINLATIRRKYDETVRKMLGPDKYLEYRRYEETKPVRMEVERIKEYMAANGAPLDKLEQATLEAVDKTRAIFFEQTHGPYDKTPEVKVGVEENIAHWKSEIARLTSSSTQLIDTVSQQMPAETVASLKSYYGMQIDNIKTSLDLLSKKRASASERLDSSLRGELPSRP